MNVNDKVEVQLFNTPDNHFYGPLRICTITQEDRGHYVGKSLRPYLVKDNYSDWEMWVSHMGSL